MKKAIITTAIALAFAGAASADFTVEGTYDYSLEASGMRFGATRSKLASSRTFTHEYGVSLGYATSDKANGAVDERTYIPLTLNYNAVSKISDKLDAYIGGRVGIVRMEIDPDTQQNPNAESEDTNGLLLAIGCGLKYKLTDSTNVRLGYELGQLRPSDDDVGFGEKLHTRTISLGLDIKF